MHSSRPRQFLLPLLTLSLSTALAPATLQAGSPEEGRVLARQCSVCHGKLGLSNDPEAPNLAGQPAMYLEKSMKDYQSGAREDRRMTLIAAPLSAEDIKALAAWYASLEISVAAPEGE